MIFPASLPSHTHSGFHRDFVGKSDCHQCRVPGTIGAIIVRLQRKHLWSTYCILGQNTCLSSRASFVAEEDRQERKMSCSKSRAMKTLKQGSGETEGLGLERQVERDQSPQKNSPLRGWHSQVQEEPDFAVENLRLDVSSSEPWGFKSWCVGFSLPSKTSALWLTDFSLPDPVSTWKRGRLSDDLDFPSAQVSLLFS